MKRSLVIIPLLVVVSAAAILFLGGPTREFTTTSSEAYDLFQNGYSQVNAFQFASAESSLTRAVELDPEFAMARALLAGVYRRTSRIENSEEQIAIADSLLRNLTNEVERAKVELTLSGLREGRQAHRDSLLAFLVSEEPDNLLVLSAQATHAFEQHPDSSREIFLHILEIEPNYAPAYNMLGYLAAHDGRYEEAEKYLRQYAFLAPDLANPHDSLGEVLFWTGKYDEAEYELKSALKIDPQFHYSLINLGRLYLDQGRIEKGETILEKVRPYLRSSSEGQRIDQYLIRGYYTWELHQRSLAAMESYVENYPDEVMSGFYNAIHLAATGDYESGRLAMDTFMNEARTEIAKYESERASRAVESYSHQYDALAAAFEGDHAAAVAAWNRYIEIRYQDTSPHDRWWVYLRMGRSQLAMGDGAAALKNARAAIDPNPNRIYPLMLLAEAALDQGEHGLAFDAMQRIEPLLDRADGDLPVRAEYLDLKARMDSLASQ